MEPVSEEAYLRHYGILRRSGRYPWGSGGNAYQSAVNFKADIDELRKGDPDNGIPPMTNSQIAQALEIKTTELRDRISIANEEVRRANQSMAINLSRQKQMSNREIAKRMLGDPNKESTIRGWLKSADQVKDNTLESIAEVLRGRFGTSRWLDVGKGTELHMNVSKTRLRAAVRKLEGEGYKLHRIDLKQIGTDKPTHFKILGAPDTTWGEARRALFSGEVPIITERSEDGGLTFLKPKPEPVSISSKNIEAVYNSPKDGVIEIRRGVPELDLGANNYAQVRVAVDGTHYLKGMAVYGDDFPPGVNIKFHTNKKEGTPLIDGDSGVLKPLKLGPEFVGRRFTADAYPMMYTDKDGNEVQSALNLVNKEGDWDKWSRSLSSQMLSKQSVKLAATQLEKAKQLSQKNFDEIMALTNPVVKKHLLLEFASKADADAVNLKAASIKGQASRVILPIESMRPNEIYAPQLDDGQRVALVRHPHGGPFEIPQLIVNNKNTTAKRIIGGNAQDAVGIHPSVAERLSGADFDGDSVLVIPNNSGRIKSKPPLAGLEGFYPKERYPETPGMTYMTKEGTQREMGKISNLITDMTIKGAPTNEIAAAVRHSMVVIDAEKHKLDYKQSEIDNGIRQLKQRYQGPGNAGASTIISRASGRASVPQQELRKASEGGPIDPETGELVYTPTGEKYVNAAGKTIYRQTYGTKMEFAKDANELTSRPEPTEMEIVYAKYANDMKALANTARKETLSIKDPPYSPAAKAVYSKEVASLNAKLKTALMNAPLERRAQAIATHTSRARIDATPGATREEQSKIRAQALADARLNVGAQKARLGTSTTPITEREWHAIQSGAVSSTTLREILNNSDVDTIKELATPRYRSSLTTGQLALAKTMSNSGRSLSEIAAALGIPKSTIADNLANA